MEKLIQNQLLEYLSVHDFITCDQSAYRKGHSTETALHKGMIQLLDDINEGLLSGACFLDIQICFDTIDHNILLFELSNYGIHDVELEWLKSYLSHRKQTVKVGHNTSKELGVDVGVPQRSVLGPVLFLIL